MFMMGKGGMFNMFKSCSRCGKIHDSKYRCNVNRVFRGGEERKLRATRTG